MQKVEGSSPFSRSQESPGNPGFFCGRNDPSSRFPALYNSSVQQTVSLVAPPADVLGAARKSGRGRLEASCRARSTALTPSLRAGRTSEWERLPEGRTTRQQSSGRGSRPPERGPSHNASNRCAPLSIRAWPGKGRMAADPPETETRSCAGSSRCHLRKTAVDPP
jgi:hypothetical protein